MAVWQDPKAALLTYLAALPITIRGVVISGAAMAFGVYPYEEAPDDALPLLRDALNIHPSSLEGARCAMLIGAIEVMLADEAVDAEQLYTELNERSPSASFAKMAARAPFDRRHFEAARSELQRLREGPLSPVALRRWSLHRMA